MSLTPTDSSELQPLATTPSRFEAAPSSVATPLSAAAVSGFIFALLGFLGVPALLGLILAAVGISRTKGGRLRGRGLAVAAIPISIVTGAVSVVILFVLLLAVGIANQLSSLQDAMKQPPAESLAAIRDLSSEGFDVDIDDEMLVAWLKRVKAKHGSLASFGRTRMFTPDLPGYTGLEVSARFVNGPATLRLVFERGSGWSQFSLDDLEIDGSSPRGR